ncbi:MAG TPA: DUF2188 domain-containing protein [bacterium]|jgi:hypothetical protein
MSEPMIIEAVPIFDGWAVKFQGTKSAYSTHDNKAAAVKAASELAQSMLPSAVKILKEDGTVETELDFAE